MLQNLYQTTVKFKWLSVLVVVHVKLNFYDSFFFANPYKVMSIMHSYKNSSISQQNHKFIQ